MSGAGDEYIPILGVGAAYEEAGELTESGVEALCPSFHELQTEGARYADEVLIGQGALKEVYRAFDRKTRRAVARARLRADRGADYFDYFVNEAWRIASLNHPNIIKIFDVGTDESGRPFFTMDLKGGTSLQDLGAGSGRKGLDERLAVFSKVCDAMAYAHSRGVIHLDLKPDNIQCDAFGEVMVCDWGLAKAGGDSFCDEVEAASIDHLLANETLMGQIKGSLGYMAPEQVTGEAEKGAHTDIYALGCMLHFVLTGVAPFSGTREEVLEATRSSKIGSLRRRFPELNIPESLDAVVRKATRLKPADRYACVAELQKEIQNYQTGYSTAAEESGFFKEASLFIARNRIPCVVAAVALMVIGVLSVLFAQHLGRKEQMARLERGRADALDERLHLLHSEYDALYATSEGSKKELAHELAFAANRVKNLGIFDRPIETVKEARKLAVLADQLDRDLVAAQNELFALNCLQLNYQAAVELPPAQVKQHLMSYKLAQAFPAFNYSEWERPPVAVLVDFFRQARAISPSSRAHLERILAYDCAARADKEHYEQVVEAFLQYSHGGPSHLSLTYDSARHELTLWSDRTLNLVGQYEYSLLRFLSFKSLVVEVSQPFELSLLDQLPIETLDVRMCSRIKLNADEVELPDLKHLILRSGSFDPEILQRQIKTAYPLEISWVD